MRVRSFWMVLFSFWILCLNALLMADSPVITSLSPYHVEPALIGTPVTITGSGFTGATAVSFGGTPATSFQVLSDTSMTATIPAHVPATVFVNVTTPSGISPNTPGAYFVYQGDWQAYVLSSIIDQSRDVLVIDTATQMVIGTIIVGHGGTSSPINVTIAITPDGTQAYVPNDSDDTVSVIDTAIPQTVIATISLAAGSSPVGIAITPDGTQAYVTNVFNNSVSVIDTAAPQMVIATIPVGANPSTIAITPDGTQAYVVNSSGNSVSVIDTAAPQMVIATINVGISNTPDGIAITPDGTQAYVVNFSGNSVLVIDTAAPQMVIATIPVGANPSTIAITPDGTQAYVGNLSGNSVSVIDTAAPQMVIATIPVGVNPISIAITPDGKQAYVANDTTFGPPAFVSIIDTQEKRVIATVVLETSTGPFAVAITPDQAPLARFTVTTAPAGSSSTFDGSGSVSPVGTIVNYAWNFGDGTTLETSEPLVSHTYAAPGNYTVTLVVTNSAGTSTLEIYTPPSIIINGGPSALSMQTITIISATPVVQNIHPSSGPTCGGTVVTITGTNFTGATAVFFGSVPATQFTVQSDTTILATSPQENPGTVNVTVVTPFGTSVVTSADQFTYLPPFPPRDLRGRQVKNRFATQTDIINILTWKAPCRFSHTCAPVAYRIYRNSSLTRFVAEVRVSRSFPFFEASAKSVENDAAHRHFRFKDHHRRERKTYPYFVVSVDRFGNISSPARVVIKGGH